MPTTPAIHILCAELQVRGYSPSFVQDGVLPDLSDLGRTIKTTIYGDDGHGVGIVPFGFISDGPEGPICTIRGTQQPKGTWVEWLDDFDAVLERCPFATGKWHRGFGRVYSTLHVVGDGGVRVPLAVQLIVAPGVLIHGHSLGAPLASYAALEARAAAPILLASPKWGDATLCQTAATLWPYVASYANPNDAVPKVPITVDDPADLFDFRQLAGFIWLNPRSVTPAIPADWDSSHNAGNYLAMMRAAV